MSKLSVQRQVNSYFEVPCEMGESDYIVVGLQYREDEALVRIKELIHEMLGDDGYENYDLDNLTKYDVTPAMDEDGDLGFSITWKDYNVAGQVWGVTQK